MNNTIVIEYLKTSGYSEEQIITIIEKDTENELEYLIREYESRIVRNGFTRKDALNTFRSFQRMKSLDYNKKKLLKL